MARSFSMTRRVQFAETDMAGVLHFANYFRMMEEVEHAFWRSLGESVVTTDGSPPTDGNQREISWPRVAARCEYRRPLRFEDELELRLTVVQVNEKSVSFEVRFFCGGEEVAVGQVKAVCCTTTDRGFESLAIPDHLRALLVGPS